MARDPKKLKRLTRLLHDLETVERAKLGEVQREINEVERAQEEILASLAEPTGFHGRFIGLLSTRVGALERRRGQLKVEQDVVMQRYRNAVTRQRSAEALLQTAKETAQRQQEQRDLEQLLEFDQASVAQGRGKSSGSR